MPRYIRMTPVLSVSYAHAKNATLILHLSDMVRSMHVDTS